MIAHNLPRHTPSADDKLMFKCRCGWISKGMKYDERMAPMYCDECGKIVEHWVLFAPHEEKAAHELIKKIV